MKKNKLPLMWCAFPLAGLGIAVSLFFALRNDYEGEIGYFAKGSVPLLILTIAAALCAVSAVILFFVFKTKYVIKSKPDYSPLSVFGIVLSIVMCIGILISESGILSGFSGVSVPSVISAVLTPAIAALFVLTYMSRKNGTEGKGKLISVIMGILATASLVLKLFAEYFDFSKPLNGHMRILTMVMQAFVLLFIISETRLCFSLNSGKATPGFYVMSSALACSVSLGLALGGIIFTVFSGGAPNPNTTIMRLALYAAVGIIAADRLLSVSKITDPKPEKND